MDGKLPETSRTTNEIAFMVDLLCPANKAIVLNTINTLLTCQKAEEDKTKERSDTS